MSRRDKFRLVEVRPIQFLLYVGLRAVGMVVDMFPFGTLPRISKALSRVLRVIDRKHVRIAAKNLARTPDVCPPHRIRSFIARVYDHVGLGFVEMLKLPRLL